MNVDMDKTLKRRILHFFFPNRCPVCDAVIGAMDTFCDECSGKLQPFTGSFTIKDAAGTAAAFVYDRNISPAVMLLKNGVCGNAAYALGKTLAVKLRESGIAEKADIIVPVPLHKSDKRIRGYNQAFLIARELSDELGLPVGEGIVIKSRRTHQQKRLNRHLRLINLKDAFAVPEASLVWDKSIILVDDVCTTGTTLGKVTSLLLENGAKAVYCAACCKTPALKKTSDEENPVQQNLTSTAK